MKRRWVHDQLRERLLAQAGCPDLPPAKPLPNLDELRRTQWSDEFERLWKERWGAPLDGQFLDLMHNRLVMGALRYGLLGRPGKPAYDNVGSIRRRLDKYHQDGNLEHMVDTANIALVEYVEGKHPSRHIGAPRERLSANGAADISELLFYYTKTGDLSWLVEVAYSALWEWLHGTHPRRHFATGDGDIHSQAV